MDSPGPGGEADSPRPQGRLTKQEVIDRIDRETYLGPEAVRRVVERALDLIYDAVIEGRGVEFRHFGSFVCKPHKAKIGRNPRLPEKSIEVPARMAVRFKPARRMRDDLRRLDPDRAS